MQITSRDYLGWPSGFFALLLSIPAAAGCRGLPFCPRQNNQQRVAGAGRTECGLSCQAAA